LYNKTKIIFNTNKTRIYIIKLLLYSEHFLAHKVHMCIRYMYVRTRKILFFYFILIQYNTLLSLFELWHYSVSRSIHLFLTFHLAPWSDLIFLEVLAVEYRPFRFTVPAISTVVRRSFRLLINAPAVFGAALINRVNFSGGRPSFKN